ncbi:hypothetical protein DV736_g3278, partial [Chaetothyriales sp. CBS 134916]
MSDFLISLWESVFTPGPTPTLLRATNATFSSLQVLLFVLLLSTHSYHFLILSILSGGLWWAINWFSAEVLAAKEQEAKDSATGKEIRSNNSPGDARRGLSRKSPEQGGSDTETEQDDIPRPVGATGAHPAGSRSERHRLSSAPAPPPTPAQQTVPQPKHSPSSLLEPRAPSSLGNSDLLKRKKSVGESSGYVSTDSEWEKVSENEGS